MNAPKTPTHLKAAITTSLNAISHVRFFRAFDDWLALAVTAFLRDDPAYIKIMSTYGPRIEGQKHPADHFSESLGAWMLTMQTDAQDYLGQIYEEQAAANKYAGQYFTPEPPDRPPATHGPRAARRRRLRRTPRRRQRSCVRGFGA